MNFRITLALALMMAGHSVPAQDGKAGLPLSHAAARLMLEQADDAALKAQKRHFPEHYDALIAQLVELKRHGNPLQQVSLALVQASRRKLGALQRTGAPRRLG